MSHKDEFESGPKESVGPCPSEESQNQSPESFLKFFGPQFDEFESGPKESVGPCPREENQNQSHESFLKFFGTEFGEEMLKRLQDGDFSDIFQPPTKTEPSTDRQLQVWKKEDDQSVEKQTELRSIDGIHTVFCIDTSCSMKLNNALMDARTFVSDYISALMGDFEREGRCHFTSLVTFGEETKLHQKWTKDLENLTLSGHGDLAMGLKYSKNAALSPCNSVTTKSNTLLRKIIVITDGRVTDFDAKRHGNKRESFSREKEEVADIRKNDVEIQFVYVGDPDIKLLEQLREINGNELNKHTSGRTMAKEITFKVQISGLNVLFGAAKSMFKQFRASGTSKLDDVIGVDSASINVANDSKDIQVWTMMMPVWLNFEDIMNSFYPALTSMELKDDWKPDFIKLIEKVERTMTIMKKILNSSYYDEIKEMQNHAPIGCRVRRGRDWVWADQDNGGPGTVVGHLYDELRKYWCWVEWDIGGEFNVYRWDVHGKCDLTIVDEDRQPKEEEILMVGCKVAPGESYEGNPSHLIGIAIKYLDDNKMQVRWEDDGSRENLTYGKDGTPKQLVLATDKGIRKRDHENCESKIQNPIVYDDPALENKSMPAPPEIIEVYDILENTANVRWQKCRDDKMSSNSKYVVTYVQKSRPHKKMVVKVVAAVSCILDDLKPASEYSVGVKFVNDEGKSLPIKTSFTTRETDTDDSCFEGWKLTEEDASRLSGAIGMNWELLGPSLGIKNVELHHIIQDNNTSVKRVYYMLLEWVRKDKNSTFGNFCKILKTHPSVCFDRDVFSEMRKEHQK